ncbi:MAG: PRD domain-containing protein [Oscillospiraceae bacterium]|nr:PRD domain-containing protein [Oscillospiraceae bacterium]
MKSQTLFILQLLGKQTDWVTSFGLSTLINLSVRTVKTYLADLNAEYPGLIESSSKGFRIRDKAMLAEILRASSAAVIPQTAEERKKYVLRKLLLQTNEYDLDMLACELCISPVTLMNEIQRIKAELVPYELFIRTKANSIFIEGPESNKKSLISRLIYDDTRDSFMDIKLVQSYLPNFNLRTIRSIVTGALKKHHYFLDDFSLLNLVLHIAISLERKRVTNVHPPDDVHAWESLVSAHTKEIVDDIVAGVENEFGVRFECGEIYDFALLIMTRVISDAINEANVDRLSQFVGDDIIRLVSLIQSRTKEVYNITITNEDFTVRFSLHLKNLIVRLKNGVKLRNPQMTDIKNAYPFIYDVSVFIADIVTKETGYPMSEDEISYFALHLGVLIEERKVIKYEARAVLLCPQYYNTSLDFANRIAASFEGNLMISGIASSIAELEAFSDYDMVISTLSLQAYTAKPWVHVSSFFTNKDVLAISEKIEETLKARTKAKVESKLRLMFKETLFFCDDSIRNQHDAIELMSDSLCAQGYVGPDFKQKLFDREIVSSSAYTNIAMPHPLEMCAFRSAIAVSVHPNAIPWNDSRVNIVFMLAINITDRLFFKDIFDFITDVISEDQKLKALLKAQTFNEFIATLVSFAK